MKLIPLFYPPMSPRAWKSVKKVLSTRWIGQAHRVDELEQKFAAYTNSPFSLATNSGTAALHLAYRLAGLQRGDEVVSPVLTCTATHHPLLADGIKIRFADIQADTLNIDPKDIERHITKKTKAIIVVHFGGIPADMERILKLAKAYKLKVIEDGAQALGATYRGRPVGALGSYTAFSFQAIKQLTTGDGGMLNLKSAADYRRGKKLRWFGIDREKKIHRRWQAVEARHITFDVDEYGYKYQMNDIAAAIGLENLKLVNRWLNQRAKFAKKYDFGLRGIPGVRLLTVPQGSMSSYWLYQILVERRDDFQRALKSRGVETNVSHVRNDVYEVFGGKRQNLPQMNALEFQYICIPMHNNLSESDVDRVIAAIKKGW